MHVSNKHANIQCEACWKQQRACWPAIVRSARLTASLFSASPSGCYSAPLTHASTRSYRLSRATLRHGCGNTVAWRLTPRRKQPAATNWTCRFFLQQCVPAAHACAASLTLLLQNLALPIASSTSSQQMLQPSSHAHDDIYGKCMYQISMQISSAKHARKSNVHTGQQSFCQTGSISLFCFTIRLLQCPSDTCHHADISTVSRVLHAATT